MIAVTKPTGRYYNVDVKKDIWYPSVTTILGKTGDKSGLDRWRKNVGDKKADEISKFAANRGTFMHLLCENYLRKRFEESRDDEKVLLKETFLETLEDKEIKTFDRLALIAGKNLFMNFYRTGTFDTLSSVILQEVALFSKLGGGYAGRVDLIAKLIDDVLVVIDFKSSGKPKKTDWIQDYYLQASAYAFAYYQMYGEMPKRAQIWISNEEHDFPQIFEMDLEDLKTNYKVFIGKVKQYHEMIK